MTFVEDLGFEVTLNSFFWLLFLTFLGLVFNLLVSHDHLGVSLRETHCILNQLRTVPPHTTKSDITKERTRGTEMDTGRLLNGTPHMILNLRVQLHAW